MKKTGCLGYVKCKASFKVGLDDMGKKKVYKDTQKIFMTHDTHHNILSQNVVVMSLFKNCS